MKQYVLICANSGLVLKDEVFNTPKKTINPNACYVELTEPVQAQPWLAQQSNEVVVFVFDTQPTTIAENLASVVLEQDGSWQVQCQETELSEQS